MTYTQLRAFHYVALLRGFSLAAEALGLTQPAVSDQVRKLEQENDVLLFSRARKKVELTPQGLELLEMTRAYFGIEDEIKQRLSESSRRIEGELRIVADSAFHIAAMVQRFRQMHPQVRVTIGVGNSSALIGQLRAFEADIGVVGSQNPGADFESLTLSEHKLVAFSHKDLFPQGKRSFTLAELASLPLVLREPGSRTRLLIEEAGHKQGIRFNPAIVAEGREAVREIVASSDCLGVVSQAELSDDRRIRSYTLRGVDLAMRETVIHLRQRRHVKIVEEFMRLCQPTTI